MPTGKCSSTTIDVPVVARASCRMQPLAPKPRGPVIGSTLCSLRWTSSRGWPPRHFLDASTTWAMMLLASPRVSVSAYRRYQGRNSNVGNPPLNRRRVRCRASERRRLGRPVSLTRSLTRRSGLTSVSGWAGRRNGNRTGARRRVGPHGMPDIGCERCSFCADPCRTPGGPRRARQETTRLHLDRPIVGSAGRTGRT